MTTMSKLNRESWLTEMARQIEPVFRGFRVPSYRVTCGWPSISAISGRNQRIGECHGPKTSKAGVFELFISPVLEKPLDVAGTVAHEMCHVVAGIDAKHGKGFTRVAQHVGLTKGKPRSAGPGEKLAERLLKVAEGLGPYPHAAIVPTVKEKKPPTSVGLECSGCGCRVTISLKWLAEAGKPVCGCGELFGMRDEEGE